MYSPDATSKPLTLPVPSIPNQALELDALVIFLEKLPSAGKPSSDAVACTKARRTREPATGRLSICQEPLPERMCPIQPDRHFLQH